jgi:hypothetical protein
VQVVAPVVLPAPEPVVQAPRVKERQEAFGRFVTLVAMRKMKMTTTKRIRTTLQAAKSLALQCRAAVQDVRRMPSREYLTGLGGRLESLALSSYQLC